MERFLDTDGFRGASVKRFLRLTVMVGLLLLADSQFAWAKPISVPIPVPKPTFSTVSAVMQDVKREKPKTPGHVYAIAGSLVAVSTFGALAAIYFARKRNTG
jgi:hypothetical protein